MTPLLLTPFLRLFVSRSPLHSSGGPGPPPQFFQHPALRAAAARVFAQFRRAGQNRLSLHPPQNRRAGPPQFRHVRLVRLVIPRQPAAELLHHAVLQSVETKSPPAGRPVSKSSPPLPVPVANARSRRSPPCAGPEILSWRDGFFFRRGAKLFQSTPPIAASAAKAASAAPARWPAQSAANSLRPRIPKKSCASSSGPGLIEQRRRRQFLLRVHSHVQRAVALETESALRPIQLRRTDPQIQNHPVATPRLNPLVQSGKTALPDFKPSRELRQPRPGRLHRRAIPVAAKQSARRRAGPEQRLRVPAAADGPVRVAPARPGPERRQDLRCQDRFVKIRGHLTWVSRRCLRQFRRRARRRVGRHPAARRPPSAGLFSLIQRAVTRVQGFPAGSRASAWAARDPPALVAPPRPPNRRRSNHFSAPSLSPTPVRPGRADASRRPGSAACPGCGRRSSGQKRRPPRRKAPTILRTSESRTWSAAEVAAGEIRLPMARFPTHPHHSPPWDSLVGLVAL